MRISHCPTMSNIIPPMISDSPPPLDVGADDIDDDDDGFGDFRVAADLAFDLSDTSVGRDSPDVWNTPSTYSEPSDEKLTKLASNSPSRNSEGLVETISEKETVELFSKVEEKLPDDPLDFEDSPEVVQELESIPFEPLFQSCNAELEKRTSPEGADAESFCAREEIFEIQLTPEPCVCVESDEPAVEPQVTQASDQDFAEFADFSTHQKPQPVKGTNDDDDDDDFDDFEFAAPPAETPTVTEDLDLGVKLSALFEGSEDECLPSDDPQLTSCLHSCLDDSSSVWGHLKDLETSHALALQWTSSSASKKLLSSLNVDSRNILVGQRWNTSMPRFAANLGCVPLEPMKAAVDDSQPAEEVVRPTVPGSEDVVPAAQFDWNSSGLTNPLDCMDKEETAVPSKKPAPEIRTESLDAPSASDTWESSPTVPVVDILLPSPVPVADILLPSPVGPDSSTLEPSVQSSQEPFDRNWPEMMTISSQLKEPDGKVEPMISKEARRVVDSLPDLSFLSAKKLLYAANANRTRFQSLARP